MELTLKDRIENLKNWSKQIEYSDENTDFLIYSELYEKTRKNKRNAHS